MLSTAKNFTVLLLVSKYNTISKLIQKWYPNAQYCANGLLSPSFNNALSIMMEKQLIKVVQSQKHSKVILRQGIYYRQSLQARSTIVIKIVLLWGQELTFSAQTEIIYCNFLITCIKRSPAQWRHCKNHILHTFRQLAEIFFPRRIMCSQCTHTAAVSRSTRVA